MNYTKQLPEIKDLGRISQAITEFPVTVYQAVRIARSLGYQKEMIDFLKLFQGEFESRGDFYARTSELVMLIQEERMQPKEHILSQQD